MEIFLSLFSFLLFMAGDVVEPIFGNPKLSLLGDPIKENALVAALRIRAKNLYDLVLQRQFLVRDVLCSSFKISSSEKTVSDLFSHYSSLALQVEDLSSSSPLQYLHFEGFSVVKTGDSIIAAIPCYDTYFADTGFLWKNGGSLTGKLFVPRDLRESESAIELFILSGQDIVRRERAVDYFEFARSYS